MATLTGFDANEVDPSTGFDPVPVGDYEVVICESESKATKAGTGSYLALTFEIIEGEFKGRRIFTNLNLDNPNTTAVEIARAELSAICRAVKVMRPNDSCELHDIPLTLQVGMEKRKDTGENQNKIKRYLPHKTGGAQKPAQAPNDTPPWGRK